MSGYSQRAAPKSHRGAEYFMIRVALVGCGKAKAKEERAARELYTGSLFRAARAYAEQCCDEWVILSAKYGLLDPKRVIEPYELRLSDLQPPAQGMWAEMVADELQLRYRDRSVHYVGLAGSEYLGVLVGEMRRRGMPLPEQPLWGWGIGKRLEWFREQLATPRQPRQPIQMELLR